MSTDWLGIETLADELDVPLRTVYAWRSRGTGPIGYRLGKHVRFRRVDVDAWLEAHVDEPRPRA